MATAISKARQSSIAQQHAIRPPEGGNVMLAYPGKLPTHDILLTPPSELIPLWPETGSQAATSHNRLYFGDNLPILASLLRDPTVRGHVRLVYIDPPYATSGVFQSRNQVDAYADLLTGASYLEFVRQRLILLRELLADNGSIYVHLDDNMAFYVKVLMDEVFGVSNFRNWITRKKCNPKNYTRKTFGNVADFLLFYTKTDSYVWHRPLEGWTPERSAKEYQYVEERSGRRYKKVPIHAPGVRNGETGQVWRGMSPPPGKHWQYTPKTLEEMDARGEIYWSPTGNPRRKVYLDESDGVPVQDIWLDFRDAHNQNIEVTGYPTEKNPNLLSLIIEASSNPGDLVLDCFAGSGTTLAVASQLERRWIGIDNSREAIATTLRRFTTGSERMGDFVSLRTGVNGTDKKAPQQATPSLFDLADTKVQIVGTNDGHRPITDFVLLSEASLTRYLTSDVMTWQSLSKTNVPETVVDYEATPVDAKNSGGAGPSPAQREHSSVATT
ncbi:site-specific DNA-methyltransferase [Candidatus Amarolinea aalborgensis]|uniref:site-specific DNA-methyltransferase n=1 Tax=Candidatus Amarolinea aalborgensis TaxID=2249329 RepID=UPI003BF99F06